MSSPNRPPFSLATALAKVRAAEDAWNSRNPVLVSMAYSIDSVWRNRDEFISGRDQIQAFLTRKWSREKEYRLIKDLWTFGDRRIAVRFQYEWLSDTHQWFRSYGNELWEFDDEGLMRRCEASINDVSISDTDRHFLLALARPATCRSPRHRGCLVTTQSAGRLTELYRGATSQQVRLSSLTYGHVFLRRPDT